jgi:putative cell wall-binding protein
MVYPTTDYYLVATMDGYKPYKSMTIPVEQEIVRWDFKMNQVYQTTLGVTRLSGLSRVDTALAIAKASYTGMLKSVVLATAGNYPDALAGSVLAYKLNAPVLLVGSSAADQEKVLSYMKASLDPAGTVYILGGTGGISSAMESKITADGFSKITRLGGADRYATAVRIAEQLQVKTGTPLVLACGENYPDALAISSIAAEMQSPVLLVPKNGLSEAVKQEIAAIKPTRVYIIGGEGAVSTAVEQQVAQIAALAPANIVRISGPDRYATSLAVAKYFDLDGQKVCVATGSNFPDALAGSVYAANYNASIILADGSLSEQVMNFLTTKEITGAALFGGVGVVSQAIAQQLEQIIGK